MWFTVLYTRFLDYYDFMKLSIGNIWHVQYSKFFLFIVLQVLHAKKDCYPIFIYIFNFLFFIVNVIDNKMYFYLNRFSTQRKSWISTFERFVKKLFKNNEKVIYVITDNNSNNNKSSYSNMNRSKHNNHLPLSSWKFIFMMISFPNFLFRWEE